MARTDFRAAAARRLSEERELSPAIVSLLSNDRHGRARGGVRNIDVERIDAEPRAAAPGRSTRTSLEELAASIREHGVLQPILVRPLEDGEFQLIAGERRWRASKAAGLATIPALVEEIDDDTALEISIIENLQREDLSPLDEAAMYDRMVREHGYSRPQARPEARQGQGLPREPAPARGRPGRGPRAGVLAQRHPVPRL